MKKIIVGLTVFLSSFMYAQQEVSVDVGDALIMKTFEASYEYYLGGRNSVGMSALFNFNGDNADLSYNEDSMITPFVRHYFIVDSKFNYFGELFLGINSGERKGTNYTDGALGAAAGIKYVSSGGIVVTALLGGGRNMFSDNSYEFVPRLGLNVGYRF